MQRHGHGYLGSVPFNNNPPIQILRSVIPLLQANRASVSRTGSQPRLIREWSKDAARSVQFSHSTVTPVLGAKALFDIRIFGAGEK